MLAGPRSQPSKAGRRGPTVIVAQLADALGGDVDLLLIIVLRAGRPTSRLRIENGPFDRERAVRQVRELLGLDLGVMFHRRSDSPGIGRRQPSAGLAMVRLPIVREIVRRSRFSRGPTHSAYSVLTPESVLRPPRTAHRASGDWAAATASERRVPCRGQPRSFSRCVANLTGLDGTAAVAEGVERPPAEGVSASRGVAP